jgi:hypothetical protein
MNFAALIGWNVREVRVGSWLELLLAESRQANCATGRFLVSGSCQFSDFGKSWTLDPWGTDKVALAPVLSIVGLDVTACSLGDAADLRLEFGEQISLTIRSDPKYEAWEWAGAGQLAVSTPGGTISTWRHQRTE